MRDLSEAERVRAMPEAERAKWVDSHSKEELAALEYDWRFLSRKKQQAPVVNPRSGKNDWSIWMVRAGRGFGKTRTGAGWVHERAMEQPGRWIALVARTPADARDYMILGPGGLMKNTPEWQRPRYEPSNRAMVWPNGSHATIYSDEVPDQLRGFSGDTAWLDELAKYRNPQATWDNLSFGMREISNDQPRILITTTPRPLKIIKDIEKLPTTVVVTGSSYENQANLDPRWYRDHLARYKGTRLGRQEISAEIVDDMPGALWSREVLDKSRLLRKPEVKQVTSFPDLLSKLTYEYGLPEFKRIVVGVDPSGAAEDEEQGNSVGIVVAALGEDDLGYVLADNTTTGLGPASWAKLVIKSLDDYQGDLIVAEKNYGGAMVEHTIRTADKDAPVKVVWASRGKIVRAEPVAALYGQGKIKHVGGFPELEDQMCAFLPEGYAEKGSPDRADAAVWALTELMLKKKWMRDHIETGVPIVR